MNIKLAFALIILMTVFSLSCVSAQNNTTDDLAVDGETDADKVISDINVTFEEEMWQENLSDISVELPQSASGDFSLKIDDEIIYNRTITEKSFKVPVKLPVRQHELVINIYPPIDCKYYKVSAFYNGIDLNITSPLKVMKFAPDYNSLHFPEEILQNDKYSTLLTFPRSANGEVEFYIDERLFEKTTAQPTFYWSENPFSKLPLGTHTFKVIYHGDTYYRPFNRTFEFLVTDVVINIPDIVEIGHNDCVAVKTQKNIQGTVKIYLDNKLVSSTKTSDGEAIISLEKYVSYKNREIMVVYSSGDLTRSKTKPLNMTYDIEVWESYFTYGEENILEISLPDTFNNNLLKITINGKPYSFTQSSLENNVLELDISKFSAGNYSLFISFPGDSKFYALNKSCNFIIGYDIFIPYDVDYGGTAKVSLKLPNDAKGELAVYIDGKHFKSSKFTNGYAQVNLGSLNLGLHNITAEYTGDDYNVSQKSGRIYVSPQIIYDYSFTAGENKFITVKVPESSKGYVIFDIDGKKYKVNVKNGIAKLSLKNLKVGDYEIEIGYYGEDGFKALYNWAEFTVKKPKVKTLISQLTFKGVYVKIKLLTKKDRPLAGKYVHIKFNGKKYKVKTSRNGILTFKKSMRLKNKKYSMKITYMGFKMTKKLKVKPVNVKITKSKRKLTVKAEISKKIKNQKITVKVNSKKYSIKTNSRGKAKITLKKPKKIRSLTATYKKATVTI